MKSKKLALVGIGYWGKVHLRYLKFYKNIFINKIYYKKNFPNLSTLKVKKNVIINKLTNILYDDSIKYVDIVTPIQTHTTLVIKFLKKKKSVLVEKPLIMNSFQEKEIQKLIKKNKKKIQISYPYLFSKTLKFANKIVKSNRLGSIKYVEIFLQQCGRFMKYDVNYLLAPHAISILSIFFQLKKMKFKINKIIKNNNKCETSFIECISNNKIRGMINLSLNYANKNGKKLINIFCQNGTITCDLVSKKRTLVSFRYLRTQRNTYKVAKVNNYLAKNFDEKNNMKYVLYDFLFKKKNKSNFNLTKIINNLLKNAEKKS